MEENRKYWYAAIIAVIVAVAWWIARKSGPAIVNQVPATSQSGLPQYSPQNASFNVKVPALAPAPGLQRLPQSGQANVKFDASRGPAYLTYNFPTVNDYQIAMDQSRHLALQLNNKYTLEKAASMQPCGCGGGCSTDCCPKSCSSVLSRFPDGYGACMAPNPDFENAMMNPAGVNLSLPPSVTQPWADNIASATNYGDGGPIKGGGSDPGTAPAQDSMGPRFVSHDPGTAPVPVNPGSPSSDGFYFKASPRANDNPYYHY